MALYQWTAVLVCCLLATLATAGDNEVAVVRGNNDFAADWYQVRAASPGNVLISPFSAATILAMLSEGAEDSTFSQLARGLHLPEDKDVISKGFQSLLTSVRKAGEGNNSLITENRIYVDSTFAINEQYKDTVMEYFSSDIVSADFMGNPEEARTEINEWVEEQTHDRIKDLLPQGTVTALTRSVLVNVIYFKGLWANKFKSSNTRSEVFYKSCKTDDVMNVDMMHATGTYRYTDTSNYQAIQMDYQDKDLSMMIILPTGCDDGRSVEEVMRTVNLTEMQNSMRSREVRLSIPKFKIEQTSQMRSDLEQLGMGIIFTDSANFSGISNEELSVSSVIQKTFIEVSEEGTEAAAATGAVIVPLSLPMYLDFEANHPFFFTIQQAESGTILFAGKYGGE